jgi:hypothetical protein
MRVFLNTVGGLGVPLVNAILGLSLLFFVLDHWGRLTKLSRLLLLMAILGSVSVVISYLL